MKKTALLFLLLFTFGQTALADMPPPVGYKYVTNNIQIETEKDFPEYSFYLLSFDRKLERIEISKDNAALVSGEGRDGIKRYAKLLAIPKASEELIAKDKPSNLEQEITEGKIPGAFVSKNGFNFRGSVSLLDSRESVTERYRLESIDAEKGVILILLKDETATAGNTFFWLIGGGLLSLAIISGGIWGFRRKFNRRR